ncbi:hypothetical protein B0H14DRAFT_1058430 [Mycena olivaceomarginata]|nr:hypothetical protein B0H14DRAFT_1058430 [Mycena olivaceomarginata]
MAVDSCTIPSNPDVSGIGVRAAIYAQNLTCFLPVIVHLWDGKISRDELKGIKDQSIGMLTVAFAILFTTIILAKGAGGDQTITPYHAAVVLDLSWMNNTSTWIWFILYAHHRTKRDDQPTAANWSEWRDALLEPVRELLGQNDGPGTSTEVTIEYYWSITERIWHIAQRITQHIRRIAQRIWRIAQCIWGFVSEQPVLTLGSIHLSLMAAVGIWLWSDPSKFGHPLDPSCDPTLTVIGVPARFSSKPLRIISLAMYSLVLIPGLNLIPPFAFFLTLHISYNWSREQHKSFWTRWDSILKVFTPKKGSPSPDAEQGGRSQRSSTAVSSGVAHHEPFDSSPNTALPISITAYNPDTQPRTAPDMEQGSLSQRSSAVVSSGGTQAETSDSSLIPLVPTVYPPSMSAVSRTNTQPGITPDTEQTEQVGPSQCSSAVVSSGVAQSEQPRIPHTAFLIIGLVLLVAINILFIVDIELTLHRNKGNQNGDDQWGFGQVLALLLLIIPLHDAWGALQDIWEKLAGVQNRCAEFLGRICQATPVIEEFERLIKDGAKPNEPLCLADVTFGNALQLVAYHGTIELVQSLRLVESLEQQGIPDNGGQFQTALQAAAARGHVLMVNFLLRSNKYAERLNEVETMGLHFAPLVQMERSKWSKLCFRQEQGGMLMGNTLEPPFMLLY